MHRYRHRGPKLKLRQHALLRHQPPPFQRLPLQLVSHARVRSCWHSSNHELAVPNLQLNKYRDVEAVKLNRRQLLSGEPLQPTDKPCFQVAVHLRLVLRLGQS